MRDRNELAELLHAALLQGGSLSSYPDKAAEMAFKHADALLQRQAQAAAEDSIGALKVPALCQLIAEAEVSALRYDLLAEDPTSTPPITPEGMRVYAAEYRRHAACYRAELERLVGGPASTAPRGPDA